MNKKYIRLTILLAVVACLFSFMSGQVRLFVIGDSISIFYGPYLKQYVEGKYEYDRKRDKGEAMEDLDNPIGANGGDSRMVVEYLKKLSANRSFHTDVLLVNCGLHDVKTHPITGDKQISLEEYRHNLDTIYRLSQEMKAKLVWVNCTPVNDSIHNGKGVAFHRYNRDVQCYNAVADSLFFSKGVPIIDMYSFSLRFPLDAYIDHVHYSAKYRKLQAAYIAGFLESLK
ncbi:SGNH/GDSL hydrolase family protein [Bacteroides graminisolvens]|jgi:hypothetical protein|uniref:SGNH hydrolase-type esterase domain-containing protein n=1 Tax=Bacteroides graminisolvens DSM 19988 = JCM 15093 TaxID=1121097 RepID=A0A069D1R8_9BACE|nr:SGNH/GDSL hydrolase family protein [Bacteroides graminisolvens]GAK36382.1 hypothetical protein JCM15093_1540 [Bacteroides graminisolvens DSM 19988 = JCM 15093]